MRCYEGAGGADCPVPPGPATHPPGATDMDPIRREFLKLAGFGLTTLVTPLLLGRGVKAQVAPIPNAGPGTVFDIRAYGAVGDGKAIDTAAINRAIEAAATRGGGTVYVPSGS